ncbi:MAG: heme A synthase [Lautropia sp.]
MAERARTPLARRLLWLALFLTFDLIMFGAFVRVADAGLGCPDWPGCYGKITPFGALEQIRAAAAALPDGPVTVFKAWIEMLHRYLASALGLLIIGIAWLAWRQRREAGAATGSAASDATGDATGNATGNAIGGQVAGARLSLVLAVLTLAWVIIQGLFGMWTVTLRLRPAVVTAHLLGAMVLFALLFAQADRISPRPAVGAAAARFRGWVVAALALVLVQIALGGWVSSNYATLACQDFPRCQGRWWPAMDLAAGFTIWRPLGALPDGSALPFQALTGIHYAHRLMAYLVLLAVGVLAWRIRRIAGLEKLARWLSAVLALQLGTGLTNIFLDWPAAAAVLHTGGATALVGILLMVNSRAAAAARATVAAGTGRAADARAAGSAGNRDRT